MKRLPILLSFALLTVGSVFAQDLEDLASKNYFAVGLSGGYYVPIGDFNKSTKGNAGSVVRIDLSLGVTFYKRVQLRLDLDNESHGENKSVPGTNTVTIRSSTLNVRYYIQNQHFKPYVSAGGGLADVKVKAGALSDKQSLITYAAGLGLEWDISKNIGVDLSGQYRVTTSKNKKFELGLAKTKLGYDANSMGVNLGMYYRFGLGSMM